MIETQPIPVPDDVPPQVSTPGRKNLLIALIVLILLLGITLFVAGKFPSRTATSTTALQKMAGITSPTPVPFAEMTIPYLRSKTYESSLGERQLYQDNGAYTSYLTSYMSSGLKVNGLLTIPSGEQPKDGWPAIVFIHGYIPPTLYATTEKYIAYVDYLARNGFVVFKIDLRGHGQSEGSPGGGYFGSDYVTDALNAYSALENADFVNKSAIGMWGHSMAGNTILRSMAVRPEIPAGVIWAGAVYTYEDQRKFGINDQSYRPPGTISQNSSRRRELFEKHGSPSASHPFWQQVAPTNYLNDLKGAISINHAEDDDVVDIGYSRDLMALLDETKVPHEFYTYPTGGHNIEGPSFTSAIERTADFFKKYLQ